jgi:TatD DNase family protein
MLHVRPSKGSNDAHDEALDILSAMAFSGQGTSHFFTAPVDVARQYWERGFATSFPGVITFAKDTREAVEQAPDQLYLAETDAPYATPVPYRGQRNEPIHVIEVVHKIAEIRGVMIDEVAEQLVMNTKKLFRLAI